MPYTFSLTDLQQAWRSFESFVDSEVYPRLMAQRLGAELRGVTPTVLEYSQSRLASMSRHQPMLVASMLAGTSVRDVETSEAQPGSRAQIPVILQGSQLQGAAATMAMRHGGQEFSVAYQTLMEAVSPDVSAFSLYASKTKNAYFYPHVAEDMPDISVPASALSHRPSLVSEIARQTAPVYQFSYIYEGASNTDRLRKARSYALRAGIPEDEFRSIAEAYENVESREPGNYRVATAAHEFAHATLQPFPRLGEKTLLDYAAGRISLQDILTPVAAVSKWLDEGQADIFSMGVSLDPMSVVRKRYYSGVMDAIAVSAPGSMRNFKLGDPMRVRVIDPRSVESTDSPLYQLIRRYSTSFAQRIMTGSANTDDLFADAASVDLDQTRANTFQRLLSPSSLFDASGNLSQFGVADFIRAQSALAGDVVNSLLRDYRSGVLSGLDPDTEELLRFQPSRMWSIGYVVGKSRPDLIGQELEVSPQGVRVASTGEEIDLGRMGLPELEMTAPLDAPEMHPIQLERGFSTLAVYNRAREALRSGFKLDIPSGGSAADVVRAWRDSFWKVMSS